MTTKAAAHDLRKIKQQIAGIIDEILPLRQKRTELNAEIQTLREKAVTLGIPKESLDEAIRYKLKNEDARRNIDAGYAIAREAIGLPLQLDLWDGPPTEQEEADKKGKSDKKAA